MVTFHLRIFNISDAALSKCQESTCPNGYNFPKKVGKSFETADSKAVFSFEFEWGRLSKIQMKTNHQIDDQLKVHVRMHCKIFISCMIQRKPMKGRYCHGIMRNY